MKVKDVVSIKNRYNFEAPLIAAKSSNKHAQIEPLEHTLDLNDFLVPSPADTYMVKVSGESMIDESIFDGDILIVDKKDKVEDGKIVIASLNGELTVKTLKLIDGKTYLFSANKKFLPIEILGYMEFQIQGVVKHVIRSYKS